MPPGWGGGMRHGRGGTLYHTNWVEENLFTKGPSVKPLPCRCAKAQKFESINKIRGAKTSVKRAKKDATRPKKLISTDILLTLTRIVGDELPPSTVDRQSL